MISNFTELILQQYLKRDEKKDTNSLKINLYKGYEVEAVANALNNLVEFDDYRFPDCFMVADSFLTTHLHKTSTRLNSYELDLFLRVFRDLIYDVRIAIDQFFSDIPLYLIADMPDGSYRNAEQAIATAEKFIGYGADAVKIEISTSDQLNIVESLSKRGIFVVAHLGYTPQTGENRVYGDSYDEALKIFSLSRKSRDNGAFALVIERVSEKVNQSLCENRSNGIPVYSIFSGKSKYGGQSLNIWDSVIRPPFNAKFFPPTADIEIDDFPNSYTIQKISDRFSKLMRLTLQNDYPLSPPGYMSPYDIERLAKINPWKD